MPLALATLPSDIAIDMLQYDINTWGSPASPSCEANPASTQKQATVALPLLKIKKKPVRVRKAWQRQAVDIKRGKQYVWVLACMHDSLNHANAKKKFFKKIRK